MIRSYPCYCTPEPQPLYRESRGTRQVCVANTGKAEAWLGSRDVMLGHGIPLGPGLMLMFESDAELSQDWYAVSQGTDLSVTVLE